MQIKRREVREVTRPLEEERGEKKEKVRGNFSWYGEFEGKQLLYANTCQVV